MKRFQDPYLVARAAGKLAGLLLEYVKAEERSALANHWPLAEFPKRPSPGQLSKRAQRLLEIEWRLADPDGFDRYQRARAALELADTGPRRPTALVQTMTRRARSLAMADAL